MTQLLSAIESNNSFTLSIDARASWNMDKKAKERAKIETSASVTKARAIVVSNSIKAALFKFLQSFDKQGYPQRIFSDWEEAYQWLMSMKE